MSKLPHPVHILQHPAYQAAIKAEPELQAIGYSKRPFNWAAQWGSSMEFMITVIPLYLVSLYIIQQYIKRRKQPYDLKWFVIPYNFMLSGMSAGLLYLVSQQIIARYSVNGDWFDTLCDSENQYRYDHTLQYLYHLTFLSKYIELIDTIVLALRGKPLIFLHVYHHAATIAMSWVQMNANTCIAFVALGTNMFVHTIMYLYYALAAMGIHPWWKRYLTQIQIIQFIIDLIIGFTVLIPRYIHDYIGMDHQWAVPCMGSWAASWIALGIILSYLFLFIQFYNKTYTPRTDARQMKKMK